MLSPKRTKYRKQQKGRIHGMAKGGTDLNFGAYGLKAEQPGRSAFEIRGDRRRASGCGAPRHRAQPDEEGGRRRAGRNARRGPDGTDGVGATVLALVLQQVFAVNGTLIYL